MSEPQKGNVFNFVYVDEKELTQSYNNIQRERRKFKEEKVWEAFCQDELETRLNEFKDDHYDLNVTSSVFNADTLLEGIRNTHSIKGSLTTVKESENDICKIELLSTSLVSQKISNLYEGTDNDATFEDKTEENKEVTYLSHEDIEKFVSDDESDQSSRSTSDCNSHSSGDHKQSDSDSSEYSNSSNNDLNKKIVVEVHAEDTSEVIQKENLRGIDVNKDECYQNKNLTEKSTSNHMETVIHEQVDYVKESNSPHPIRSDTKTLSTVRNVTDLKNPGKSASSEINVLNKYCAQAEKISWTRERIVVILKSILAYEENMRAADCSDDSDTGRLRKRAGEFAKRFARNYVYQPKRKLDDLKKSMDSSPAQTRNQPRVQITAIVDLHQSLLKALQEYKRQLGRLGEAGTDLACHSVLQLLSKADKQCRRAVEILNITELRYAFKHDMQPLIDSILTLIRDTNTSSSSSASARTLPRSQTTCNTKSKHNIRSSTQTRDAYNNHYTTAAPVLKTSPTKRNSFTKAPIKPNGVDLSMYTMNTPWPESPVKKNIKQNKLSPKTPKNNNRAEPKATSRSKLNISQSNKQNISLINQKFNMPHSHHKHKSDIIPATSQSRHKQNIPSNSQNNAQSHHIQNIPSAHSKQNITSARNKPNIPQKERSQEKVPPILIGNLSPRTKSRCHVVDNGSRGSTSKSGTEMFRKKCQSSAKVKSDRSIKTMVSEVEIEDPELELNEELCPQLQQDQVYKWFKSTEISMQTEDSANKDEFEEKRYGPKNAQLIFVKEQTNSRKLENHLNNATRQPENRQEKSKTEISANDPLGEKSIALTKKEMYESFKPLLNIKSENSKIKLDVTDNEWKKAHSYRQKYVETLVDSPMYSGEFEKPWELVGRMSGNLADDLLQKVILEMQDDIVQALCHVELQ